jgi:hypothetical protein
MELELLREKNKNLELLNKNLELQHSKPPKKSKKANKLASAAERFKKTQKHRKPAPPTEEESDASMAQESSEEEEQPVQRAADLRPSKKNKPNKAPEPPMALTIKASGTSQKLSKENLGFFVCQNLDKMRRNANDDLPKRWDGGKNVRGWEQEGSFVQAERERSIRGY